MSFLQFLTFFALSELIVQVILVVGVLVYRRFTRTPLEKAIKSGQIKMLTPEEFQELMEQQEKKTWN